MNRQIEIVLTILASGMLLAALTTFTGYYFYRRKYQVYREMTSEIPSGRMIAIGIAGLIGLTWLLGKLIAIMQR